MMQPSGKAPFVLLVMVVVALAAGDVLRSLN